MASTQPSSALSDVTQSSQIPPAAPPLEASNASDEAGVSLPAQETVSPASQPKTSGVNGVIDQFLNLLSSVPFGIVLLVLLIIACMIGMLIQQIELETFPAYYAELTPAEKQVYGTLGFFDIYHVWYFNLLLLLLSLNIILASIDHFPSSWSYISRKKLTASPRFALAQKFKEQVDVPHTNRQQLTDRVVAAARKMGFKVRVSTTEDARTTVFAERGVWNRLGAYVVHIGLLTIFFGGFMTSRGFTGMMPVVPDQTSDQMMKQTFNIDEASGQHNISAQRLQLPFKVVGVDIQQKPIKKEGGVDASNTLDWLTRIRIDDPETGKKTDALVHMNHPFDYRGYRFFQASLSPENSAREIKLRVSSNKPGTEPATQEITIKRNGDAKLPDGTRVKYVQFNPGAQFTQDGKIDFATPEYVNPAAQLLYITPDGTQGNAWAFNEAFLGQISSAPFLKQKFLDPHPYFFVLTDFEKVSAAHYLSVQYDPGVKIVYVGFTILCLTLLLVFFFSHQRLWIVVEDGTVYAGGDANRNRLGFEDRARKLLALVREPNATT